MSTNSSDTLPGFPTELLIQIFTYLPIADLLSVQHSCCRFYDVISNSNSLQYFLRTEVNLLEDLLPPDFSLEDRVTLLKNHETAWNNLELNTFAQFMTREESPARARCYVLQDGYLIYKATTARYGYTDLYSSSAIPNAEAPWTHIRLEVVVHPFSDIVFAVDQNLVVAISGNHQHHEASFFEFKTGVPHPLSLAHTIYLNQNLMDRRKPEVEFLGDYILITTKCGTWDRSIVSVISWKTGSVTELSRLLGEVRVVVIDRDDSLIALIKGATNSIEICRLQSTSAHPTLHTLCFLRLPIFKYTNPISVTVSGMEWTPTLDAQDRTESQTSSRRRPFPFRSYKAGTIGLTFGFRTRDEGVTQYSMFVSVEALLSAARSGVRHVPWDDWGPAGTRILPLGKGTPPTSAGPFWITNYAPLVVHDYSPLRAWYIKRKQESSPSILSYPSLGPPSTKLLGEHWAGGEIQTNLPFRKFVAGDIFFERVLQVVADREWVVVISRTRSEKGTSVTVYRVG